LNRYQAMPLSRHPVTPPEGGGFCGLGTLAEAPLLPNRRDRTVLVVFTKPLWPIEHGNQERTVNMLRWLKSRGYRTILIMPGSKEASQRERGDDTVDEVVLVDGSTGTVEPPWAPTPLQNRDVAAERSLEFFRERIWCSTAMRAAVHKACLRSSPAAVIANYIFMAPVFQAIPDSTLRIIDTHDTFSRQAEKVSARGVKAPLACSPEIERSALLAADVILAIQPEERKYLAGLVPERDVITVGVAHDRPVRATHAVKENTVLFVGSSNIPNQDGIRYFLGRVWPLVLERMPSATLRVAGRICDALLPAGGSIELMGYCEDLDKAYAEAALVINATRVGTGLKIKSLEAIAHGKPLVAWPDGLEGLPRGGSLPFVESETEAGFADAVVRILSDAPYRRALEDDAYAYACEHFASSKVFEALQRTLDAWMIRRVSK